MGYFPNGTSGDSYEEKYCNHCIHEDGPDGKSGCAVMLAHLVHNYKECNNEDSILHMLIPRKPDGFNDKCLLYVAKQ